MILKKIVKNLINYLYSISVLSLAITALMIIVKGFEYGFLNFNLKRLLIYIGIPISFYLFINFLKNKID